jgi:hypothetical protein
VSESREILALRKDLLIARGTLQRLKIAQEAGRLRESLGWRRAAAALTTSPGRSLAFGLLMLVAGRGRLARLLRITAVGISLVKLSGLLRSPPAPPAAGLPPAPSRDSG